MTYEHRPDSTRSPYAVQLDDLSLDAWDDDRTFEYTRALDQTRQAAVVVGLASRSPSSPEAVAGSDRVLAAALANLEIADCWNWQGAATSNGYGALYIAGGRRSAHRFIYEMLVGPVPPEWHVDHLCRNKLCCNPDHLEPVPAAENVLRGVGPTARNARKTHCHRGHPLSGDDVYLTPTGRRVCRACQRLRHVPSKPKPAPPPKTHCKHGHPFDEDNTYWRPNGKRACRLCAARHQREAKARKRQAKRPVSSPGAPAVTPALGVRSTDNTQGEQHGDA